MRQFIHRLKYNPKFRSIMTISLILSITLLVFINSASGDIANDDPLIHNELLNAKSSIQKASYDYVCIVDAGSTGSRIHVYRYTKKPRSKLIEVDIKSEQYQKFYPGLSSFEDHPKDLAAMSEYFEPILNFGRDKVPLSKRTATPLFVLASAGMRKVRDRNTDTAQQIMDLAYQHLSGSEFIVLRDGIKIIEGRNEGLWGWIAANYLNGELTNLLKLKSSNLYSGQTSKGVLEMGGESLQITFIPSKSSLNSLNAHPHGDSTHHIETVHIGDMDVKLFTYSWMGIGMEAAQNQYDTYLATKVGEREKSPCYIRGDVKERQHGIGQSITWQGTGSFGDCYKGLSTMIKDKLMHGCVVPEIEVKDMICTPNKVLIPAIDLGMDKITVNTNEFYYIENFYYTAKVLNLLGVHGREFLDKLQEKGEYYCSLDVEKAKSEYPDASEEEIKKTCFCASWLLAILNSGFNLEKFERFRVIRDIEGEGNIDWALGYLVAEVPNMNLRDAGIADAFYTFRFALIMMVIALMICWYKGGRKHVSGLNTKSWIYSKMGLATSTGNKKENTNKYAYQRVNVRRTH
eukprot:38163_1